ncbi:MAG: peptidylprolyl isomerase [Chitinophagaceae bacterium]|nr:peptidylprolyl isomerase [Chitinophagaceae bacterium]MDP1764532.1 peptidylprolyl isomerase [Sediminibacterium sp.]
MKHLFIIVLVLMTTGFTSSFAQSKKVVADKIVGQVGDKIILRSDILNSLSDLRRQAQGQENVVLPTECQILEGQLIRKALVLQAQKDSIPVSEEEIDAALDNKIRLFIQSYGSKDLLEEIAGKTVYQIKEDFKESFREQKLADLMQNKIVDGIKITPTEVKQYYLKIPADSLPFYESEIEVSQIIIHPKANKDVEEYVSKQLYDYKKQAEQGGGKKFDQLAKLYSEDPAVKENGGQYTLNRNDKQWDPAFLSGAFRLKEGQISIPIKSKFGLHIIMMVSRSGDEAIVKHILRIPPVTEDEITEAKQHLDSIRKKIIDGSMSFGAAVSKYSDDENSKFSAGAISSGRDGSTFVSIDQLDKDMIVPLGTLQPGDYSAPLVYTDERGRKVVRLIYLKNRTAPHRENLKEDYNRVSQRALEEKKSAALEKWFKEHIPTYFISIDKDFSNCSGLEEWRRSAANAEKARN